MKFKNLLNEAKRINFDDVELSGDVIIAKRDFRSGKNWITVEVYWDTKEDKASMTVSFRISGKVTTNQNTIVADPTAILQAIEFVKQFSDGDPNNLNTVMLNKLINE